jgi:hypothetical protein
MVRMPNGNWSSLVGGTAADPAAAGLTRYGKIQVQERGREVQRLDKVLRNAGIKLSTVAADVLGVSRRAMLDSWSLAHTTPRCWPRWPRGRLRTNSWRCGKALTAVPRRALRLVAQILVSQH